MNVRIQSSYLFGVLVVAVSLAGCRSEPPEPLDTRTTLNELLLQDARTCSSGFTYPQDLIDGLSTQLIEELRCMDDTWLEFYTPCEEPGCIATYGPQPLAIRPEVIAALREAALSVNDYITISAGYRDVAMQYYSRWYKENCSSSFNAAIPGNSNHQGGRAVDVRAYNFWWDTLLEYGFEHPIPSDEPHFELLVDAEFRQESEELKVLSITAFQRLWNRNNPDDMIDTDGIYGPTTKDRLGNSPVEGFDIGACPPGSEGDPSADAGDTDPGDVGDDTGDVSMDPVSDTTDDVDDATEDPDPADVDEDPDVTPDASDDTPAEDTASEDTSGADAADSGGSPDLGADQDTSGADVGEDGEGPDAGPANPVPAYSIAGEDTPGAGRGCAVAGAAGNGAWAVGLCVVGLGLLRRRRRDRRLE